MDATPRELANRVGRIYYTADFPNELADFADLAEWYTLIDHGDIGGGQSDLDEKVIAAARALVEGRLRQCLPLDGLFTAAEPTPPGGHGPVRRPGGGGVG